MLAPYLDEEDDGDGDIVVADLQGRGDDLRRRDRTAIHMNHVAAPEGA